MNSLIISYDQYVEMKEHADRPVVPNMLAQAREAIRNGGQFVIEHNSRSGPARIQCVYSTLEQLGSFAAELRGVLPRE